MKGLLVRVGVDQAYGGWNAPMDPVSRDFVYVPIPEDEPVRRGMVTFFSDVIPRLKKFCRHHDVDLTTDLRFPEALAEGHTHPAPDFAHLTYVDGPRRGAGLLELTKGDLVSFYAGLRPTRGGPARLTYALIGLYVVDEVRRSPAVPRSPAPPRSCGRPAGGGRDQRTRVTGGTSSSRPFRRNAIGCRSGCGRRR
jgi:hypothetical protein